MVIDAERARTIHDELNELTGRLVAEHSPDVPAGAVIRLVARIVRKLRAEGVPADRLAETAEPIVRAYLERRRVTL